ncbi:hypothetical protein V8C37DRAFT_280656 [Trichoderma ceciliae]
MPEIHAGQYHRPSWPSSSIISKGGGGGVPVIFSFPLLCLFGVTPHSLLPVHAIPDLFVFLFLFLFFFLYREVRPEWWIEHRSLISKPSHSGHDWWAATTVRRET